MDLSDRDFPADKWLRESMDQGHPTQNATQAGGSDRRGTLDPAEDARRELIQWCEEHGLPVPPERQDAAAARPRG
jgi:hypothetical protein